MDRSLSAPYEERVAASIVDDRVRAPAVGAPLRKSNIRLCRTQNNLPVVMRCTESPARTCVSYVGIQYLTGCFLAFQIFATSNPAKSEAQANCVKVRGTRTGVLAKELIRSVQWCRLKKDGRRAVEANQETQPGRIFEPRNRSFRGTRTPLR